MILSNGILNLEFDDRTGSLVSLRDVSSGEEHLLDTQETTLFRLIVPGETWQGRFIEANQQACTIDKQGDRLTITYDHLSTAQNDPQKPGLARWKSDTYPIRSVITVTLPAGSREAYLEMQIDNLSQAPIVEVWFPRLGGWAGYAGPGKDTVQAGYTLLQKSLDPYLANYNPSYEWTTILRFQKRWSVRYPPFCQLPWLDISGGGRGLSLINYMRPARVGGWGVENLRGYQPGLSLAFGWYATPDLEPGKSWSSPRFGLSLHAGDWHATARRYRDWLNTWWRPPASPERLYRMLGIQNVFFSSFDGTPIRTLDQIPAVARTGVDYGIYDLCAWDYLMLGNQFRLNPIDIAAFTLDEETRLRKALDETRAQGVSTSMLINYRVVSPFSDFYKRGGERGVMRMRDGSVRSEPSPISAYSAEVSPHYMGPEDVVMCQRSQEFRQAMIGTLDKLIDIGFDAVFVDQPFEHLPCYAPNHGHTSPEDTHQAVAEWIGEFRTHLLARYPQGYIIGEMPDVEVGQVGDLWWNWYWPNSSPEVMAYGMPPMLNSYVTDANLDHAQQGFLHGFLLMLATHGMEGTLGDVPQFAEVIRRMAALRARTYAFTVQSQFSDVDGLTCEGAQARLFLPVRPGVAPAVTIINQTDQPSFARIRLDGGLSSIQQLAPGQVYHLDGTTSSGGRLSGDQAILDIPLAARDVAVWEIKP